MDQFALVVLYLIVINHRSIRGAPPKFIILYYQKNKRLCLQNAWNKFCNLTSYIRKFENMFVLYNILSKFIMLMYNNQIFRNCFVIIHYHLSFTSNNNKKVSPRKSFTSNFTSTSTVYRLNWCHERPVS